MRRVYTTPHTIAVGRAAVLAVHPWALPWLEACRLYEVADVKLVHVQTGEVKTFAKLATDQDCRLFYSPAFLKTDPRDIPVLLLHEIMHWISRHFERGKLLEPLLVARGIPPAEAHRLVNVAMDCAINWDLAPDEARWDLIEQRNPHIGRAITPASLAEEWGSDFITVMATEVAIAKYIENQKNRPQPQPQPQPGDDGDETDGDSTGDSGKGDTDTDTDGDDISPAGDAADEDDGGDGDGGEAGDSTDESDGDGEGSTDDNDSLDGDGDGESGGPSGDIDSMTGACAPTRGDSAEHPWDTPDDSDDDADDIDDDSGSDTATDDAADSADQGGMSEAERAEILEDILDIAEKKGSRGTRGLPGTVKRAIQASAEAKAKVDTRVAWEEILAADLADSFYRTPDGGRVWKYGVPDPVRMRGLMRPGPDKSTPLVMAVIDTSGSMRRYLDMTCALVESAVEAAGGRLIAAQGDTNLQCIEEHLPSSEDIAIVDGGGTHMGRVIIEALARCDEEGWNPVAVILVTDGETPYLEQEDMRGLDLHIVLVCKPWSYYSTPEWATVHEAYDAS